MSALATMSAVRFVSMPMAPWPVSVIKDTLRVLAWKNAQPSVRAAIMEATWITTWKVHNANSLCHSQTAVFDYDKWQTNWVFTRTSSSSYSVRIQEPFQQVYDSCLNHPTVCVFAQGTGLWLHSPAQQAYVPLTPRVRSTVRLPHLPPHQAQWQRSLQTGPSTGLVPSKAPSTGMTLR